MSNRAKESGRSRLDASLLTPALSQRAELLEIVREQLCSTPVLDKHYHAWTKESIDKAAEKRTTEIFTFLEALRSARQEVLNNEKIKSPLSWKIKEETDLMRVMYRPGPEGTPFHTYCVEGIVNGPMVNAVCVSWEAPSYRTWWPQFNAPTFKVVESKWVKRVRVGEDLSHIRVKVPWPLAPREVLMTEFELEYVHDDIVIVVLGTAPSDPDEVEEEVYGFSADELPPATQDVVRMDVAGGFILQKITDDQSFFRTLVNMDIKLEIIPPWVINFITRQLVGSGYKLYQKAVLSSKPDGSGKVFQQLLTTEPLYNRIKSGVFSSRTTRVKSLPDKVVEQKEKMKVLETVPAAASSSKDMIERFSTRMNGRQEPVIQIDTQVERALQVLDRMIELVRDWKSSQADFSDEQQLSSSLRLVESDGRVENGYLLKTSQQKLGCFGSGRRRAKLRRFFSRKGGQ